ncbi:hypothetical protein [Methanosarcina mazei]|nr:hypothetical protein [Methanosarcina mazei]
MFGMNLFLDTNVLLGYIFETDHWNYKSLEVVNCFTPKYSSLDVCKECTYKYESKLKGILSELRKFGRKIRLSKTLDDLESYLRDECVITGDILIEFLNLNTNVSKNELMIRFTEFQRGTEKRCHSNYKYLLNEITFHQRHVSYDDLYNLCLACGFVSDDADDVEIVIDAHDLGLKIDTLLLVTGDYNHIVPRRVFIINNTSLSDVIGLGQFNRNLLGSG